MNRGRMAAVGLVIALILPACSAASSVSTADTEVAAAQSESTGEARAETPETPSGPVTIEAGTGPADSQVDDSRDDRALASDTATPNASVDAGEATAIREVDFRDGFTYLIDFGDDPIAVTVEGPEGVFESRDGEGRADLFFLVTDVQYGDLDGDGDEEAIVATALNTGGSGVFDRLSVWDLVDDEVVERSWIGLGDRADGGLWHYDVIAASIITETFRTDQGACCPNMIDQTRWVLGASDLIAVEQISTLRWVDVTAEDGLPSDELTFLPGTTAAVLSTSTSRVGQTSFDAAAGQWVTVTQRRGTVGSISLVDATGTTISGPVDGRLAARLTDAAPFTVVFEFSGGTRSPSAVFDIQITDSAVGEPPYWAAHLRRIDVLADPSVVLTAARPEFGAGLSADAANALNDALTAWILDETDWWVEDVIEYPPLPGGDPDDPSPGGAYELAYEITGIGDGLLAVRWSWYEYVCCRPYPNHGYKAVIVDLDATRIVPVEEILDLDRIDEIHALWLAEAVAAETLPEDFLDWYSGVGVGFSSLGFTPVGLEFGTDRSGPYGGSLTVLSWAELGDLVRPEYVDRMQGAGVPTRIGGPPA